MATNYTSEHTGAEIDRAVTRANNPDTAVTDGSEALVSSGAVYDAIRRPSAEEAAAMLQALGINVSAETINYLEGLNEKLITALGKKVNTTDTIGVNRGGTGRTSLTADSFLAGNGTSAVKLLTPAEVLTKIGAAASEHTHDYLPLSGGTLTGTLYSNSNNSLSMKLGGSGNYSTVIGGHSSKDQLHFAYGLYGNKNGNSIVYGGGGGIHLLSDGAIILEPYSVNWAATYGNVIVGAQGTERGVEIRPNTDNNGSLGYSGSRWKYCYSVNGVSVSSDARLKENTSDDFTKLTEAFAKLRPVTYEYADIKDGKTRIGFIAQELEETFKEVGLDPDKFALLQKDELDHESDMAKFIGDTTVYSLNYSEFIALNTAMIQRQQAEIESLRKTVEDLVGQVGGDTTWQ